jgi:hypothetical protein
MDTMKDQQAHHRVKELEEIEAFSGEEYEEWLEEAQGRINNGCTNLCELWDGNETGQERPKNPVSNERSDDSNRVR